MKILDIKPPKILAETSACPDHLYAIGNLKLIEEDLAVAIVGSRRATGYGLHNATRVAKELASAGIVVVSGLALGIDAAAHRGALEANGKTIAVLGSAIDKFEPATNEPLARKILEHDGLILSEYPRGSITYPANFVLRNRIIAGLSRATIVIEAQEKSGALITANLAAEYNRLVYALPGDVEKMNSRGTNLLIANGATCLADTSIIFEDLGLEKSKQIKLPLNDREKRIVVLLDAERQNFDKIVKTTKIKPPELLVILTTLELKGIVRKDNAGEYLLNK
jgi:DNA processing protein